MREGFVQKRCPRCGGNIYVEKDFCGWNEKCLQCGYTSELPSIVEVREKASKGNLGQAEGSARVR